MSLSRKERTALILKNQAIVVAMFAVFLVFALLSPQFSTRDNVILIFRQVATIAVMGCGMSFVIIGGNFDLSVGSLLSLCCVMCISLHDTLGPIPAILITVVVGIASGMVCGFLVGYLRLNSMIVTLGMMNVLQALTLMFTGGSSVTLMNQKVWFTQIGKGSIAGIPYVTIIMIVCIALYAILLNKTVFGHHVLAVGSNDEACRYSGINDKKVVLQTFVLSGVSTAVGAIMLCSRGGAAQNTMGQGYEFDVITGVILGGANLNGGSGSILKTLVGVMIIGILKNGFVIIGLPYYLQWLAQCLIILLAVWISIKSARKKALA
ncbi:ABC transporter permease [Butyricicoccus sp. Marseille-Q5471]|uniref:ABC transporter permease n=1 Tax=Butyricicoccus sp. Marseille-Q5471 TaxID=3039493 RepID=UPI0024BD1475|nr:ABC transporter permease [Butyricicoccus sp. Marseille-Q5471]